MLTKQCQLNASRAYYARNKHSINAKAKERRQSEEYKEHMREYMKEYRLNHFAKFKEYKLKYYYKKKREMSNEKIAIL